MNLKSFSVEHFRKYKDSSKIIFANRKDKNVEDLEKGNVISSSLIVGPNNAGKSSLISSLLKSTKRKQFVINDFNFAYLKCIYEYAISNKEKILLINENDDKIDEDIVTIKKEILPFIKFSFELILETEDTSTELLTFISPLLVNDIDETGRLQFYSKYEIKEEAKYIGLLCDFLKNANNSFEDFIVMLSDNNLFSYNFYNDQECENKADFDVEKCINVSEITYDTLNDKSRLSKAFNEIYKFKVKEDKNFRKQIDEYIKKVNGELERPQSVMKQISNRTNEIMGKTVDSINASMELRANFSIESLLSSAVKYVFKTDGFDIPEDQFGMGYTSLMLIIAQMIEYIDESPDSDFKNKINILLIDEPECYMHPQMQRLFIQNIDQALKEIVKDKKKDLNFHILISSHSSNVLKGKIDVENSFDCINYLLTTPHSSTIINFEDSSLGKELETNVKDEFAFFKKHLKYNCCEMLFSEACIVVEGYAEETIIPFYLERDSFLNRRYISVFAINGAHSKVYKNFFKKIGIPICIVTDIDIEPEDENDSDEHLDQIVSLDKTKTTNASLKEYGIEYKVSFNNTDNNIFISTQSQIGKYYPTSFEEALILTNSNNEIIKKSLKETRPRIFKNIDCDDLDKRSHFYQKKLDGYKGEFATNLLFRIINEEKEDLLPTLPKYILDCFDFIKKQLKKEA